MKLTLSDTPKTGFLATRPIFVSVQYTVCKSFNFTHLSQMDFPTLISRTSPFQFKGCWVAFLVFILIITEHSVSKQVENMMRCHILRISDLGLHCFPVYHKKDARLRLVNL